MKTGFWICWLLAFMVIGWLIGSKLDYPIVGIISGLITGWALPYFAFACLLAYADWKQSN